MDKTNILLNLLKNKEFEDLDLETLSSILGKKIYVINKVYCHEEGESGTLEEFNPENLYNDDDDHVSTFYLTDDKFMPLNVIYNEISSVTVKTLSGGLVGSTSRASNTGSYKYDIKIVNEDSESDDGPGITDPCLVDVYVEYVRLM